MTYYYFTPIAGNPCKQQYANKLYITIMQLNVDFKLTSWTYKYCTGHTVTVSATEAKLHEQSSATAEPRTDQLKAFPYLKMASLPSSLHDGDQT